jgi:hypothetical protein
LDKHGLVLEVRSEIDLTPDIADIAGSRLVVKLETRSGKIVGRQLARRGRMRPPDAPFGARPNALRVS